MMNELVSIIMPSYNTANFISKTIKSVLEQTYENWELLIVDDCSTDDTDKIVFKYTDKRITYLKNKKNLGAAISRNIALKNAKGKWIAFLDSDDLWYPTKLEEQIKFMKKNKYSFSYTSYIEIDEYDRKKGIKITGPKKITKKDMYHYCWPGCLTVMYDAEKVGNIQIIDIKKNNDYAMWLKIIKKTDCYYYDKVLAQYRKRAGSISNHGYLRLIKWHYELFRKSENKNIIISLFLTLQNLVYGCWKKLRYVKKVN